MTIEILKIPEDRKGVLIGNNGSIKKHIEKLTKTKIKINSDVSIEGDPEKVFRVKEVVKAIARGFTPENALNLLDYDYQLIIINLHERSEKAMKRLLGRVIGRGGKSRKILEESTDTSIVVYGKTVSIIGKYDTIQKAVTAVEDLLSGRTHAYTYKKLRRENK